MHASKCHGQVRNLRFRSASEGPHGAIQAVGGQIKVTYTLPELARPGVNFEAWCFAAASNMINDAGCIELSMHTLHSLSKKKVKPSSAPIRANMKSNDRRHYMYQLEPHWILAGTRALQKTLLSKQAAYCQRIGVPNITALPINENRNRLCLAFTVYEFDVATGRRHQAAPTVFSNYIYNCSLLHINAFIQCTDPYLLLVLSDTFEDYQLRMWHVNTQDRNKTCWKLNGMQCLQSEGIISGNRNPQLKLRKALNMLIYKAPQFDCPVHAHEDGPFDIYVQVYHGEIESEPLKVAYRARSVH